MDDLKLGDIPIQSKLFSQRLKDILDELCKKSDTTVIKDIGDYQQKHRAYIGEKYGRFLCQFEMYFSALTELSLNINYLKKKWHPNRGFQFIIATYSLKQAYSAYMLLLDGFYGDAIALQRSVYESFLRVVFISMHPDNAYNAYYTNSKEKASPKFNATNLVNNDLKLKWANYRIMSAFTHSNMYDVISDLAEFSQNGQMKPITLTYELDENMMSIVINYFLFLMAAYLKLYTEVFTMDYSSRPDKEKIDEHYRKVQEYTVAASLTLKTHSDNAFWRKVGYDVDDIIALVKAMDTDMTADWKVEWQRIRKKSAEVKAALKQ